MSGIGIFLCSGEVIVRYPILHSCNKGGRVTKSDKFCIGDWGDEAIYRRTDDIPLNADAVAGGESVLFGVKSSIYFALGVGISNAVSCEGRCLVCLATYIGYLTFERNTC